MKIEASSPEEYLNQLPEERKQALSKIRDIVQHHLPDGYEENMTYDMISYTIPLEDYPNTYNKKPLTLLSIGNQKNHMALYMNNLYSDPELNSWFVEAFKASGKKLDMGKSCVRFKSLDDLPLDIIGEAVSKTPVDKFINLYEASRK
ncbi:MAG: DUF1801 domain-containing protein [Candidatus Kariarchaeaceae archaeon]|jgi:uncharacterized protein YdhG (YjbR/CyaY superfamily)